MSSQFVCEAVKLRNIQKNLEKTYELLQERILQLDPFLGCLVRKLSDDRSKENTSIQNEILDILEPLNSIKQKVTDLNAVDLAQLKTEMVNIQNKLHKNKSKLRATMDCLEEQGSMLEDEIGDYEQRILEWSQPVPLEPALVAKAKNNDHKINNFGEEVREFVSFVSESKGHQNGWSVNDHNMFLKLRSKYEDVDQMAQALHKIFPDISVQDIVAHEVWYAKYTMLKSKQKEAIKDWREKKTESHSPKTSAEPVKTQKKIISPKEDKKTKEKLAAWKEQQREKALLEDKLKKLLEVKRKNEEMIRKLKNHEAKQQVQRWKMERIAILNVMEKKRIADEQREKELKAMRANSMIKKYQSQDKLYIDKKIKISANKGDQKPRTQMHTRLQATRDPARVQQPTKQWLSRTKPVEINKDNYVCDIKLVSRLGQPIWRTKI